MAVVRKRIAAAATACGRDPASITLIAASKRHSLPDISGLRAAGVEDFGENYVQELAGKAEALAANPPQWHFIGHLQRNKVKVVLPWVHMLHTVDSERLANAVQKAAVRRAHPFPVLLQINIGGEESKDGVAPVEALDLARHVAGCPNLELRGLMTVPPPGDPERWLGAMAALRDDIQSELSTPLPDLSMGMSGDLEVAIKHGATHVRIGTALFGARS